MTPDPFASLSSLRAEICRVGAALFARAYVHGTAGNISVRVPQALGGGFLITPTDACLGFLAPDALAWVGDDGQQRSGARASKTLQLHRRIYAADARAHCIIHTHSSALVARSLRPEIENGSTDGSFLPPITPYFVMKVGRVPLLAYRRPGDPQVAEQVAALVAQAQAEGRRLHAVMLARLGPNVWHETPAAAMAVLEELEETARLCERVQPPPEPLSAAQIDELRQHFAAPW